MTHTMTLRLDDDTYEALRAHAFASDTSMNDTVRRAVQQFLTTDGHREQVDALIEEARTRYRSALDKLAEM